MLGTEKATSCPSSAKQIELIPQPIDKTYSGSDRALREQDILLKLQAESQFVQGVQLQQHCGFSMNQPDMFAPHQHQWPASQVQFLYQMQGVDAVSHLQQCLHSQQVIMPPTGMQVVEQHSCNTVVQPDMQNQNMVITDHTTSPTDDSFVDALAIVTEKLLQKPRNSEVTRFHGVAAPQISVGEYLTRIKRYFACSNECFVLSLIYMDRVVQKHAGFAISVYNWHRLVVTAVVLAAKFFDDVYYSNAYYGRVGGIRNLELNVLESHFLSLLDFHLFVSVAEYEQYKQQVCEIAAYTEMQAMAVHLAMSKLHNNSFPPKVRNCRQTIASNINTANTTATANAYGETTKQAINNSENNVDSVDNNALYLDNAIQCVKQLPVPQSDVKDCKKDKIASNEAELASRTAPVSCNAYCPFQAAFASRENQPLRPLATVSGAAGYNSADHQALNQSKHFDYSLRFEASEVINASAALATETSSSAMKQNAGIHLNSECVGLPSFMALTGTKDNAVPHENWIEDVDGISGNVNSLNTRRTAVESSSHGRVNANVSAMLTFDDGAEYSPEIIDDSNSRRCPTTGLVSLQGGSVSQRNYPSEGHMPRTADVASSRDIREVMYKENKPLHDGQQQAILLEAKRSESPEIVSWQEDGVISLDRTPNMIVPRSHSELSQTNYNDGSAHTEISIVDDITNAAHEIITHDHQSLDQFSSTHEALCSMCISAFQKSLNDLNPHPTHHYLHSPPPPSATRAGYYNNSEQVVIPDVLLSFDTPVTAALTTTTSQHPSTSFIHKFSASPRGIIDTACRHVHQQQPQALTMFHYNAAQQICERTAPHSAATTGPPTARPATTAWMQQEQPHAPPTTCGRTKTSQSIATIAPPSLSTTYAAACTSDSGRNTDLIQTGVGDATAVPGDFEAAHCGEAAFADKLNGALELSVGVSEYCGNISSVDGGGWGAGAPLMSLATVLSTATTTANTTPTATTTSTPAGATPTIIAGASTTELLDSQIAAALCEMAGRSLSDAVDHNSVLRQQDDLTAAAQQLSTYTTLHDAENAHTHHLLSAQSGHSATTANACDFHGTTCSDDKSSTDTDTLTLKCNDGWGSNGVGGYVVGPVRSATELQQSGPMMDSKEVSLGCCVGCNMTHCTCALWASGKEAGMYSGNTEILRGSVVGELSRNAEVACDGVSLRTVDGSGMDREHVVGDLWCYSLESQHHDQQGVFDAEDFCSVFMHAECGAVANAGDNGNTVFPMNSTAQLRVLAGSSNQRADDSTCGPAEEHTVHHQQLLESRSDSAAQCLSSDSMSLDTVYAHTGNHTSSDDTLPVLCHYTAVNDQASINGLTTANNLDDTDTTTPALLNIFKQLQAATAAADECTLLSPVRMGVGCCASYVDRCTVSDKICVAVGVTEGHGCSDGRGGAAPMTDEGGTAATDGMGLLGRIALDGSSRSMLQLSPSSALSPSVFLAHSSSTEDADTAYSLQSMQGTTLRASKGAIESAAEAYAHLNLNDSADLLTALNLMNINIELDSEGQLTHQPRACPNGDTTADNGAADIDLFTARLPLPGASGGDCAFPVDTTTSTSIAAHYNYHQHVSPQQQLSNFAGNLIEDEGRHNRQMMLLQQQRHRTMLLTSSKGGGRVPALNNGRTPQGRSPISIASTCASLNTSPDLVLLSSLQQQQALQDSLNIIASSNGIPHLSSLTPFVSGGGSRVDAAATLALYNDNAVLLNPYISTLHNCNRSDASTSNDGVLAAHTMFPISHMRCDGACPLLYG